MLPSGLTIAFYISSLTSQETDPLQLQLTGNATLQHTPTGETISAGTVQNTIQNQQPHTHTHTPVLWKLLAHVSFQFIPRQKSLFSAMDNHKACWQLIVRMITHSCCIQCFFFKSAVQHVNIPISPLNTSRWSLQDVQIFHSKEQWEVWLHRCYSGPYSFTHMF